MGNVKLWISSSLELRHSPTGWPTIPKPLDYGDPVCYSSACESYDRDIKKAKEESILVELTDADRSGLGVHCSCPCHKPGATMMHFAPCCNPTVELKPNGFIDFAGEVEVVYQALQAGWWVDIQEKYFIENAAGYRKVARLKPVKECDDCWGSGTSGGGSFGDENCTTCNSTGKEKPVNSAHSFTEGSDPGVGQYYQKEHSETEGLKARMLEAFNENWIRDVGIVGHDYAIETLSKVLDELGIK